MGGCGGGVTWVKGTLAPCTVSIAYSSLQRAEEEEEEEEAEEREGGGGMVAWACSC